VAETLPTAAPLPMRRSRPFDPPEEYTRLRTEHPVSPLAFPDGKVGWLLTRYEDVRAVLADTRFSSRRALGSSPIRRIQLRPEELQVRPGSFIAMDPPEHTRYRRLLTGQFTVRRMRQLTPLIEQIVTDHLNAMERSGPPADLVQAFALPIPSLVICELLGVPYADRADFQHWSSTLLSLDSELDAVRAARDELRQYMHDLVLAKRRQPTGGLLSDLIHTGSQENPLTDEELVSIGTLLLIAGHETTANMLALGTFTLLQHPEQLAALRKDPALLDHAIEELLRYLSIAQFGLLRVASEDLEIGGQRIRAGETVVASLPAANRDPVYFPDPDQLDVTRQYSPHLAFGHGVHQCLGQQLARVEMKVAFDALLRRFPTLRLATPAEQVPMRDDMLIYGVHELQVTWDGDTR
jgi:cytochrome P450